MCIYFQNIMQAPGSSFQDNSSHLMGKTKYKKRSDFKKQLLENINIKKKQSKKLQDSSPSEAKCYKLRIKGFLEDDEDGKANKLDDSPSTSSHENTWCKTQEDNESIQSNVSRFENKSQSSILVNVTNKLGFKSQPTLKQDYKFRSKPKPSVGALTHITLSPRDNKFDENSNHIDDEDQSASKVLEDSSRLLKQTTNQDLFANGKGCQSKLLKQSTNQDLFSNGIGSRCSISHRVSVIKQSPSISNQGSHGDQAISKGGQTSSQGDQAFLQVDQALPQGDQALTPRDPTLFHGYQGISHGGEIVSYGYETPKNNGYHHRARRNLFSVDLEPFEKNFCNDINKSINSHGNQLPFQELIGDAYAAQIFDERTQINGYQVLSHEDQAFSEGGQTSSQGDQALLQVDQALPQGDQALSCKGQIASDGYQTVSQGDQALLQGEQALPQGEEALSQGSIGNTEPSRDVVSESSLQSVLEGFMGSLPFVLYIGTKNQRRWDTNNICNFYFLTPDRRPVCVRIDVRCNPRVCEVFELLTTFIWNKSEFKRPVITYRGEILSLNYEMKTLFCSDEKTMLVFDEEVRSGYLHKGTHSGIVF